MIMWYVSGMYTLNPDNAVIQFPVPGMPASRRKGLPASGWFLCQRDAGKPFRRNTGIPRAGTQLHYLGKKQQAYVLDQFLLLIE